MDIKVKINPFHNANYYLDVNFDGINIESAKEVFEKFAKDLDKPLQIMISSEETEKIEILKAAGFVCKRKCYEVEAKEQDYISGKGEGEVQYSHAGEVVYEQCCERMLDRYILTHKDINPWSGSKEDFYAELPGCVAYFCVDGKQICFAFVEDEEIAYVYGENMQEFRAFAKVLIAEMFGKYDSITFEADDCDKVAMELKSMFANQDEESFDTYIMLKKGL